MKDNFQLLDFLVYNQRRLKLKSTFKDALGFGLKAPNKSIRYVIFVESKYRSQTSEQDEVSFGRRRREPLGGSGVVLPPENFEIQRLRNALSSISRGIFLQKNQSWNQNQDEAIALSIIQSEYLSHVNLYIRSVVYPYHPNFDIYFFH